MRFYQWLFAGRRFCRSTQYLVVPVMMSRIYEFADEVTLCDDDRRVAGLAGSIQAQQFAALAPDEYGTS